MNVRFYKAAQREFDEAVAYYDAQLPGLGQRYRKAVQNALERIEQFPGAYPPFSERTRFPYGIIYKQAGADIIVVAAAH